LQPYTEWQTGAPCPPFDLGASGGLAKKNSKNNSENKIGKNVRDPMTSNNSPQKNVKARKIKVGLVQINNSFSGQNYLPYSVGLLQAYCKKFVKDANRFEFMLPLYKRMLVKDAVEQLCGADIIFFSTYVWNVRISLEIAKHIKHIQPKTITVFGGPQVPDRSEEFLREYPFVDVACHGEGEQVALAILENSLSGELDQIPSISYIQKKGVFVQTKRVSRLPDLAAIPSPYLTGVFDSLIKAYSDETWIAMWETNRGCPFSCTFCDWGSATQSKVFRFEIERLEKEVDWFADNKIEFVYCADANFGMLPRDLDIAKYVAVSKRNRGYPHALSVQNTKNATERSYEVQKTLSEAGLNKGVTISFQSMDPETLKSIKRANISTESFRELQTRFTRDKVISYSDMILALPGETYASFANGVSTIIEDGQHNRIQFGNLSILPNSQMGDSGYQKKYGMQMVESEVVNIHGSLQREKGEVVETQQLVIATNSMPKADWVKTRAFCWMTALLHFDKLLQIPLILIHEVCGVSYRELIEVFSEQNKKAFPVIFEITKFFKAKAKKIQEGDTEFCRSEEWLNIWWPADEYYFIKLCVEGKLEDFYKEAEEMLKVFLEKKYIKFPEASLKDAFQLNKGLIKAPFHTTDLEISTSFNVWDFYQAVLVGQYVAIEEKTQCYKVDRTTKQWTQKEDWYREVVWYGNKKGDYLYANAAA
jgi:radical SAM superfamily enzyme YgiQ (UPF0313 family)